MKHVINSKASDVSLHDTPCPSIHLHFGTYLNSDVAGQINFIFYEVKVGTGRFVIKYGTIGYMLMWGVISWVKL